MHQMQMAEVQVQQRTESAMHTLDILRLMTTRNIPNANFSFEGAFKTLDITLGALKQVIIRMRSLDLAFGNHPDAGLFFPHLKDVNDHILRYEYGCRGDDNLRRLTDLGYRLMNFLPPNERAQVALQTNVFLQMAEGQVNGVAHALNLLRDLRLMTRRNIPNANINFKGAFAALELTLSALNDVVRRMRPLDRAFQSHRDSALFLPHLHEVRYHILRYENGERGDEKLRHLINLANRLMEFVPTTDRIQLAQHTNVFLQMAEARVEVSAKRARDLIDMLQVETRRSIPNADFSFKGALQALDLTLTALKEALHLMSPSDQAFGTHRDAGLFFPHLGDVVYYVVRYGFGDHGDDNLRHVRDLCNRLMEFLPQNEHEQLAKKIEEQKLELRSSENLHYLRQYSVILLALFTIAVIVNKASDSLFPIFQRSGAPIQLKTPAEFTQMTDEPAEGSAKHVLQLLDDLQLMTKRNTPDPSTSLERTLEFTLSALKEVVLTMRQSDPAFGSHLDAKLFISHLRDVRYHILRYERGERRDESKRHLKDLAHRLMEFLPQNERKQLLTKIDEIKLDSSSKGMVGVQAAFLSLPSLLAVGAIVALMFWNLDALVQFRNLVTSTLANSLSRTEAENTAIEASSDQISTTG